MLAVPPLTIIVVTTTTSSTLEPLSEGLLQIAEMSGEGGSVETRRLYRLPSSAYAPPDIRHDSGDAGIGMGGTRVLGCKPTLASGLGN